MEEILCLFPEKIKILIEKKIGTRWYKLQEVRLRLSRPIEFIFDDGFEWMTEIKLNKQDGIFILHQLSDYSLYRLEDELRQGYITINGGHRVGIAGTVNTIDGAVKAVQHIAFFNIRIAKAQVGIADKLYPYLYKQGYLSTLIVGPPQTGKTTLIRDLARLIGTGWGNTSAHKVGIIDERSEIAAAVNGIPKHDVGLRTDVLDACPKAEGMMMMIRSMSPEVLIVDEIGSEGDVAALIEALNAGVVVICTIHGKTLAELKKRPSLKRIFEQQVFNRYLFLDRDHKPGQIVRIYNEQEMIL